MKNLINHVKYLLIVGVSIVSISNVNAATISVANAPLINSTVSTVLPNLLYILDNSGSMGSDYIPDYVNDTNNVNGNGVFVGTGKCKTTGTSGAFNAGCGIAHPPYNTSVFNSIYYNPAITYSPALNASGTELTSMTSANTAGWTSVPNDAFGIQSNSNTSLALNGGNGYYDIVWCNKTNPTSAERNNLAICKKNSQYIFPNNTGTQNTSFNQGFGVRGHPYYYTVAPGEYCTTANLTSCITATAATATHTFPAKIRWCNSSALTDCQAKNIEDRADQTKNYVFARWAGIDVNTGSFADGTITINPDTPNGVSPSNLSISDITVDGIRIIAAVPAPALTITDTISLAGRTTLANNIAAAINAYEPPGLDLDFTATASGDVVTIKPVALGTFMGTINVSTTGYTLPAVPGVKGTGSINITRVGKQSGSASPSATRCLTAAIPACNVTISATQINVGSANIIVGSASYTTGSVADSSSPAVNRLAMAKAIKDNINSNVTAPDYTATCGSGTTATVGAPCTSTTISITAVSVGTASNGAITISPVSGNNFTFTTTNVSGGTNPVLAKNYILPVSVVQFSGGTPAINTFQRIDIKPGVTSYAKAASRTDCISATTCTYAEEMTNFANWYSYYRTRMQMMKTSTTRAFGSIDDKFRVGFTTINLPENQYVPIAKFDQAQKTSWYAELVATIPANSTPLRPALSTAGRIFAGKNPVPGFTSDPMQYACQQNFALLTTDGYWNGGSGKQIDGSTDIGNEDSALTPQEKYEGTTASSNSLADVAAYYANTDIRSTANSNCTGAISGVSVCEDTDTISGNVNFTKQIMNTLTLGLGVDGQLGYTSDYKEDSTGDFAKIKAGTLSWPKPVANEQTAVDDLWHAAVNGNGTYFSAKDPQQLSKSLVSALKEIGAKKGAGAAAATSTLNPVTGDNTAYVASYVSKKWTGNLEARSIDVTTGKVDADALWAVEDVISPTSCLSPNTVEKVSNALYYCVETNGADTTTKANACIAADATNVVAGNNCKVVITPAKDGALKNQATRNIYHASYTSGAADLAIFENANLTAVQKAYFSSTSLSTALSQWNSLSTAQQTNAAATNNLINYIKGNTDYDDRSTNSADNQVFRKRDATLGDAIDSTPKFLGKPKASYSDSGYGPATLSGSFKNAQASRSGTVYLGTNDGMLHAFNAEGTPATNLNIGQERWAFIPSAVMKNLPKLADRNYDSNHVNFVNGDVTINDICISSDCTTAAGSDWRTILVGSLSGGGVGYYALDVTDPNNPELLWEFGTSADFSGDLSFDGDIGLSFGNPVITKKGSQWVVMFTSGYNNSIGNVNEGKGFLYVVDAKTGNRLSKIATGAGDSTNQSGLSEITAFADDSEVNNTAGFVYGGDLLGNVWRFDITAETSFLFAKLTDPNGDPQPVTTAPEIGLINDKTVVFVGTGKYLETSDLSDTQKQSFYAIVEGAATVQNYRVTGGSLVNKTLQLDANSVREIGDTAKPDLNVKRGWYIDWLDNGERVNVKPKLVLGGLLVPTLIPSNAVCSPGGYGYLNIIDYQTGNTIAGNALSQKFGAPIVGINVVYINGKPVASVVTADDPTPKLVNFLPPSSTSGFQKKRIIWRELTE